MARNVFVWLLFALLLVMLPKRLLVHAVELLSFPNTTSIHDFIMNSTETWDEWYDNSDGHVWLTPNPFIYQKSYSSWFGSRFAYAHPIEFIMDDGTFSSFTTQFTFQIITTQGYGQSGSGLAFFIAPEIAIPFNSTGRWLGLTTHDNSSQPSRHLFAVEFDTHLNQEINDSSSSHVGIDVNSLVSISVRDTNQSSDPLFLYNNSTFTVWIDYNSSSSLIQVWMINSNISQERPASPFLSTTYNLSTVFEKYMYVGISAATGGYMEGHLLYAWNFSTSITSMCVLCGWKLKVVLGVGIFSLAACIIGCIIRYRKAKRCSHVNEPDVDSSLPRYSYQELRRATHGFSEERLLGSGAFSHVYKGTVLGSNRSTVAVKRLKDDFGKDPAFPAEIRIISSIRHRNLLQMRGWCYERGKALLVYDYMANGSLDRHLFGHKQGAMDLTSNTRLNILKGVAAALEYLHEGLGECVLHRDVKAANVLLNADLEPLLGDFGLARFIAHDQIVTMTAAGTPGYVAPEVSFTGKATHRADVYSFGILALEVACGRRILNYELQPQEMNLLEWVWLLHQSDSLLEAIDPRMQEAIAIDKMQEDKWRSVLHVALSCCHPMPDARPRMRFVHQVLQESRILPLPMSRPSFPYQSLSSFADLFASSSMLGTSSRSRAARHMSTTSTVPASSSSTAWSDSASAPSSLVRSLKSTSGLVELQTL